MSSVVDRLMRALLGLPGRILERLDGTPRLPPEPPADAVLSLVRRHAVHPEAQLALEEGLHHHLVGEGDARLVVAYQVRGSTAFGLGGLNAPPDRRRELIRGYRSDTAAAGVRRHLLFPVRAEELDDAQAEGFAVVQVGVEAVVDLPGHTWRGNRFGTVRQMRNRARRRGVAVAEERPEKSQDELTEVFARWLDSKRPSWRMRLLVGSPGLDRPLDRRYFVARTPGRVEAFCTVLPSAPGVFGVDVMCRRPDAEPGTMELLLTHVIDTLRDEGANTCSLGPCPMAGVALRGERPVLRWVFHALYASRLGNALFGFRNLHRFKQKFRPRWEPVWFAAAPRLGALVLYRGCRMWGLY